MVCSCCVFVKYAYQILFCVARCIGAKSWCDDTDDYAPQQHNAKFPMFCIFLVGFGLSWRFVRTECKHSYMLFLSPFLTPNTANTLTTTLAFKLSFIFGEMWFENGKYDNKIVFMLITFYVKLKAFFLFPFFARA